MGRLFLAMFHGLGHEIWVTVGMPDLTERNLLSLPSGSAAAFSFSLLGWLATLQCSACVLTSANAEQCDARKSHLGLNL